LTRRRLQQTSRATGQEFETSLGALHQSTGSESKRAAVVPHIERSLSCRSKIHRGEVVTPHEQKESDVRRSSPPRSTAVSSASVESHQTAISTELEIAVPSSSCSQSQTISRTTTSDLTVGIGEKQSTTDLTNGLKLRQNPDLMVGGVMAEHEQNSSKVRRTLGVQRQTTAILRRHQRHSGDSLVNHEETCSLPSAGGPVCSFGGQNRTILNASFAKLVVGLRRIPTDNSTSNVDRRLHVQQASTNTAGHVEEMGSSRTGNVGLVSVGSSSVRNDGVAATVSGRMSLRTDGERTGSALRRASLEDDCSLQSHCSVVSSRERRDQSRVKDDGAITELDSGDDLQPWKSAEQNCTISRSRRYSRNCDPLDDDENCAASVETVGGQAQLKDCVVVLRRSSSVEKMLEDYSASDAKTSSSNKILSIPLSSVSVGHQDRLGGKLLLRKSRLNDIRSPHLLEGERSADVCVDREGNLLAGKTGRPSKCIVPHISVGGCGNRPGGLASAAARQRLKRRRLVDPLLELNSVGLRAREHHSIVGQQTAGASDKAVVGQTEVTLPQHDPDLSATTPVTSVSDSNAVISLRPDLDSPTATHLQGADSCGEKVWSQSDQDFTLSPSLKRAKVTVIVPGEADLDHAKVMAQPNPDSRQILVRIDDKDGIDVGWAKVMADLSFSSTLTAENLDSIPVTNLGQSEVIPLPSLDLQTFKPAKYASTVGDDRDVGQAEVTPPQPDPDCLQFIDAGDFTGDHCSDSMFHMALFSSPETSELGFSPPSPSTPTESFPAPDSSASDYQPVFCRNEGALLPDVAEPLENLSNQLMADSARRPGESSTDIFPSTSSDENIFAPLTQQPDVETNTAVACGVENSSSQSENLAFPVGDRNVDIGPTPCFSSTADGGGESRSSDVAKVVLGVVDRYGFENNLPGLTPNEELLKPVLCFEAASSIFPGNENCPRDQSEDLEIRKGKVSIIPSARGVREKAGAVACVAEDDVVVLYPDKLPPPRHQVMSDLASSSRSSLLQSVYDAFCYDAGDLPPQSRYNNNSNNNSNNNNNKAHHTMYR